MASAFSLELSKLVSTAGFGFGLKRPSVLGGVCRVTGALCCPCHRHPGHRVSRGADLRLVRVKRRGGERVETLEATGHAW